MASRPSSLIPGSDLSLQVRRADEDRWLASRFAPANVRDQLIALYVLNDELARTAEVVSTPALADIRLAWWREGIGEIYRGAPARAHPVLAAFAAALPATHWRQSEIELLIEAWAAGVESAALPSISALEAHFDATAGRLMRLALVACGADADERRIAPAARAWGAVAWVRAARAPPQNESQTSLLDYAEQMHAEARRHAMQAPAAAFPALGYVALVPGYIRALRRGQRERALFLRQLKLVAASATGTF